MKRNDYVQRIDKAQYQPLPEVMAALVSSEIETIKKDKTVLKKYLQQEKGSRKANAIPYELQVDATNKEDDTLQLDFNSYKKLFKTKSAGVPFTVYALTKYYSGKGFESGRNWNFTVAAGDQLSYSWPIAGFENGIYQLAVHGPNGFYRFFTGNKSDSKLDIQVIPNILKGKKYGAISLLIENKEDKAYSIKIKDNAYGKSQLEKTIAAHSNIHIDMPLENSFGWYDFTISLNGHNAFIRTYAGHVENGKESMSDPQLEL